MFRSSVILRALFLLSFPLACRGLIAPRWFSARPGDSEAVLTWEAVPEATLYNVKQAPSAIGPFTIISTNTSTSVVVTNLRNGTPYFFTITAISGELETVETPRLRVVTSAAVLDVLPAGGKVEKLAGGFAFTEGPVWNHDKNELIFSDIDGNRLNRWVPDKGVSIFRQPSNRANGNTLDLSGRLITCEQTSRSITRTEPDGRITTLADFFNGKRFNEPNDVVVKRDGTIWFTDPTYGNAQTQPGQYVYRIDLAGNSTNVTVVATNTTSPNGICFSRDEKQLFVADNTRGRVLVYDVQPDNTVTNSRTFASMTGPDGIRMDSRGRLFVSSDAVLILDTNGTRIGRIPLVEQPANLCFGGMNEEMLFVTARNGLYGITRLPDLVVTAIQPVPETPIAGQLFGMRVTVKNQGTRSTSISSFVRVKISVGSQTNRFLGEITERQIGPDESVMVTCSGVPMKAAAGSFSIRGELENAFVESNRSNNALNSTLRISDPGIDTDGDGSPDADESVAGTDAQNPSDYLRITQVRPNSRGLTFGWTSVPGKTYRLWHKGNLADLEWSRASAAITAESGMMIVTNSIPAGGTSFFQLSLEF